VICSKKLFAELTARRERTLAKLRGAFPNQLGTYLNHDDMVKRKFLPLFARLAVRWKEERRNEALEIFPWHALRHFAISCWIDAGFCRRQRPTSSHDKKPEKRKDFQNEVWL
jgi:hypothetical protein